ncbi:MAG: hypothetical protein AB7Q29_05510 [Vicinamibacterales bacterium]
MSHDASRSSSDRARGRLLQLAVSVVTAGPLVAFSAIRYFDYDEAWHVFIAEQKMAQNFWYEVASNAHPPLFYLLLGQVIAFGKTLLVYRSIGIAAAIGSSFLVGRILMRLGASLSTSLLMSAAFALSGSTLRVGVEIRAYMLAGCFGLMAFHGFLDLLSGGLARPALAPRLLFGLGALLAILTHYSSLFVFAGCGMATLACLALSPECRQPTLAGFTSRAASNVGMLLPPLVALPLVAVHIQRASAFSVGHLSPFIYDPARQSVGGFLADQTVNLSRLFVPLAPSDVSRAALALLMCGFTLVMLWRHGSRGGALLRATPAIVATTILICLAIGGLLGRYPYGGEVRHQYVIYPYLVIAFGVAVDLFCRQVRTRWKKPATAALTVAALLNGAVGLAALPWISGRPYQFQVDSFRRSLPSTPTVLVDQFTLIVAFMHHDEWNWTWEGASTADAGAPEPVLLHVWRVSSDDRAFHVCGARTILKVDLDSLRTFKALDACRRLVGSARVALLTIDPAAVVSTTPIGALPIDSASSTARLAQEAGLSLEKLWRSTAVASPDDQFDRSTIFAELAGASSGAASAGVSPARP